MVAVENTTMNVVSAVGDKAEEVVASAGDAAQSPGVFYSPTYPYPTPSAIPFGSDTGYVHTGDERVKPSSSIVVIPLSTER